MCHSKRNSAPNQPCRRFLQLATSHKRLSLRLEASVPEGCTPLTLFAAAFACKAFRNTFKGVFFSYMILGHDVVWPLAWPSTQVSWFYNYSRRRIANRVLSVCDAIGICCNSILESSWSKFLSYGKCLSTKIYAIGTTFIYVCKVGISRNKFLRKYPAFMTFHIARSLMAGDCERWTIAFFTGCSSMQRNSEHIQWRLELATAPPRTSQDFQARSSKKNFLFVHKCVTRRETLHKISHAGAFCNAQLHTRVSACS